VWSNACTRIGTEEKPERHFFAAAVLPGCSTVSVRGFYPLCTAYGRRVADDGQSKASCEDRASEMPDMPFPQPVRHAGSLMRKSIERAGRRREKT
jgi:hypothetical protein